MKPSLCQLCTQQGNLCLAQDVSRDWLLTCHRREGLRKSCVWAQGLLEDVHAERQAREAEDIPEVDEHGKKLTKKQQAAAKKKAEAERTKQTQDEGTRIEPKVIGHERSTAQWHASDCLAP